MSTGTELRIRKRRPGVQLIKEERWWPLDAPGMPFAGPDFLAYAAKLGCDTVCKKNKKDRTYVPGKKLITLYKQALRTTDFSLPVKGRAQHPVPVAFVPGHIWGQNTDDWSETLVDIKHESAQVDGPHPADVMVIGKMPWEEETAQRRNLVGPSGEILVDLVAKLRIKGANKWYITNVCKFMPPDQGKTTLMAGWIADCLPLLHAELRIVRPKYILCLGADASKTLLGKKFTVGYMAGRAVPYTFSVHRSHDEPEEFHTAQVMTVLHPAEVCREPAKGRILESNFRRFAYMIEGHDITKEEEGLDHRVIDTLEDAEAWAEEVEAYFADKPRKHRLVAWDAEWQGQHPVNEGSYLRTVQVSWAPKSAVCFKICHTGGGRAFKDRAGKPAFKRLVKLLNNLMIGKRAVGHFFVSDLEWLNYYGIDPVADCPIPLYQKGDKLAWERLRDGEGWIDTGMLNHAIEETAPLGLEMVAMRYTSAPRYDIPLDDWKKAYCAKRGIKKEALEGYGDCDDEVLHPYANYDADVARRIARSLLPLLDHDYEGNCVWEAFWESMIIQAPILQMHKNGILVDRKRVDVLTTSFFTAREQKEEEIRHKAKWPEFNIRSLQHVREFLFGERYSGKRDKETGATVRIRPKGALSLGLTPLLDTSKPPRLWSEIAAKGQEDASTPGTSKMILGIMARDAIATSKELSDQIGWLRDHRFLDQVLKSVLRPPVLDDDGEINWVENDDGFFEYDSGLAGAIDDDGRVRTHIYPTAETGRWKHSRPNLANLSKSRDPDYKRMLGDLYKHKIRSILKASPGYVFLEFDYIGAELYMMALMSGSKLMREHCERALLKESDPRYYDIHSNVAVLAFNLKCAPTKSAIVAAGLEKFRTLAKNVIFGIAYGRGAKAIALAARENGNDISVEEAQAVIDAIFAMYPELIAFFEEAKERATVQRWLANCFGRHRRFPSSFDSKMDGEFERQAQNFPIQAGIASCVDRGMAYLYDEIVRQGLEDDIRLLLQIHDAGLVECRYDLIEQTKSLVNWAFCQMVEIWPTDLAGEPTGEGPFRLGLDYSISLNWGESLKEEDWKKLAKKR